MKDEFRRDLQEQRIVKMYETMSMTKIGREVGIHRNNIPAILRRNGVHIRTRKEWVGPLGGHWKGGQTHSSSGYIYTQNPTHPNANNHGYVAEHRLVMEKKLGRYLDPLEIVHHINGDQKDNRPENLEVQTRSAHVHNHFAKGKKVMELEERVRNLEKEILGYKEKAVWKDHA